MQSDEEVGKVAQAVPIIIYILFQKKTITKNAPQFMHASNTV